MKLYLIYQTQNDGYDTYSDAIVLANSEYEAQCIHPSDGSTFPSGSWADHYGTWASNPDKVIAKLIGEAINNPPCADECYPNVICASFHAG